MLSSRTSVCTSVSPAITSTNRPARAAASSRCGRSGREVRRWSQNAGHSASSSDAGGRPSSAGGGVRTGAAAVSVSRQSWSSGIRQGRRGGRASTYSVESTNQSSTSRVQSSRAAGAAGRQRHQLACLLAVGLREHPLRHGRRRLHEVPAVVLALQHRREAGRETAVLRGGGADRRAAPLLDRGPDGGRQVRPLQTPGGPSVGDRRGLHRAILAATGRRSDRVATDGSGGPGERVRRRAAVPELAQQPRQPRGPVCVGGGVATAARNRAPAATLAEAGSSKVASPAATATVASSDRRAARSAGLSASASSSRCTPGWSRSAERHATATLASGVSAPSSRATSMRESSCRDQCSCSARRSASRPTSGRGGGTVLDRADQRGGRGSGWRVSVVMSTTLGIRARRICRRGAGACVPAHGRSGAARLRPESDVLALRAALPSSGGPPRLRAAHEAALGGERAARLPPVDRRAHRLRPRSSPASSWWSSGTPTAWSRPSGSPRSRWSRGSPSCGPTPRRGSRSWCSPAAPCCSS